MFDVFAVIGRDSASIASAIGPVNDQEEADEFCALLNRTTSGTWSVVKMIPFPNSEVDEDDDVQMEGDCTPTFEGGYWTDPNDPTA